MARLGKAPCPRGGGRGHRGRFPLADLSDWAIYCEHGRFEPETIAELERCLDEA